LIREDGLGSFCRALFSANEFVYVFNGRQLWVEEFSARTRVTQLGRQSSRA